MVIKSRAHNPPIFSNYRKYKPYLRLEFDHSCSYCEIREPELGGQQSFCVEHYKPKKKFPSLINIYQNLLYACRHCNQWKGEYWPSVSGKILGCVILNPFVHDIDKHLDKNHFGWKGKTIQGSWNIKKFRLDSPIRILQRNDRKNVEDTIAGLNSYLDKAKEKINFAIEVGDGIAVEALNKEIKKLNDQIDTLKRKIFGPME